MIVVDTNLLVHLHVRGPHTAASEHVLLRDPVWLAPLLWRSEFRNVLSLSVRAHLIDLSDAFAAASAAERRMSGREYGVPSRPVLELAQDSGCTAYDCEFVYLARHLDTKLVTTDRPLLVAFPDTAVSPGAFVEVRRTGSRSPTRTGRARRQL